MTDPVKRYDPNYSAISPADDLAVEADDGMFVMHDDYARLEQEYERWKETAAGLDRQNDAIADELAAALKQVEGFRELLTSWRRMFDGGICSGSLGTLCDQTDAALSDKPCSR